MAKRAIPLYVSATTWTAPSAPGSVAPLSESHARLADADWSLPARKLRTSFGTAKVQILLSARQCRFQVLPWLSSCYTGAAIRQYVADAFAEAAAVSPASHHIQIDWPRYGEPVVAAAYPRATVDAVSKGMKGAGLDISGVESSATAVLRRCRRSLGAGASLLVYAEDDGICGISIENHGVVQIETLSGDVGGLDDIAIWSARKQFQYSTPAQMRWLETAAKPDAFTGASLALPGLAAQSPGHGVVLAWQ